MFYYSQRSTLFVALSIMNILRKSDWQFLCYIVSFSLCFPYLVDTIFKSILIVNSTICHLLQDQRANLFKMWWNFATDIKIVVRIVKSLVVKERHVSINNREFSIQRSIVFSELAVEVLWSTTSKIFNLIIHLVNQREVESI